MKKEIHAYDTARDIYQSVESMAAALLRDTMRCENPGRTDALALLTGRWVNFCKGFKEIDDAMNEIKRLTLAPILGFYIGDLVIVQEDGFGKKSRHAIVSNICMPHLDDIDEGWRDGPGEDRPVRSPCKFHVFLEPAESFDGFWISPERAGSTVLIGTLSEIISMVRRRAGATPTRTEMDLQARRMLSGRFDPLNINDIRRELAKKMGGRLNCIKRNDVLALAALEQTRHAVYPDWNFQEGDLVLVKFKDEVSFRHIVFLCIDMQTDAKGVLHYLDGEVFDTDEEADPCGCTQPMNKLSNMGLFMSRDVHGIPSDGAMGHILLAALVQRENLRSHLGRWARGYKEPRHVTEQRAHLKALKAQK